MTQQETELNKSANVGGSPEEAWVSRDSPQGWGHCLTLANSRSGSPQAKQLPQSEHNPTYEQIIGLKLY